MLTQRQRRRLKENALNATMHDSRKEASLALYKSKFFLKTWARGKNPCPLWIRPNAVIFSRFEFSQASHCLKKWKLLFFGVLLCLNRLDGYASDYSKKMHDMSSFSFQCRRALRKTLIAKAAAPIPCSSNGPSPSEKKGTGSFVGTG